MMTYAPLRAFILAAFLLRAPFVFAWPPTFGAEFTFSNAKLLLASMKSGSHIVANHANEAARDSMKEAVEKNCDGCKIAEFENQYGVKAYRVSYPDGFWFQINTDPGVVEIQMKAVTVDDVTRLKDRIEKDIFGAASEVGLSSKRDAGGGHIHIGLKSGFGEDVRLLRNYLADYANHPELTNLIFSEPDPNSPPINRLKKGQRDEFKQILAEVDSGEITSVEDLSKAILDRVYHTTPSGWAPPEKYQAVNLNRIASSEFPVEEKTVEMRAHRAQRSVDEFLDQIRLYQARLEFLKKNPGVIDYVERNSFFVPNGAKRFAAYVTESGLNWKDYAYFTGKPRSQFGPASLAPYRTQFHPPMSQVEPPVAESRSFFNCLFGRLGTL